jgi:hypothetical protein
MQSEEDSEEDFSSFADLQNHDEKERIHPDPDVGSRQICRELEGKEPRGKNEERWGRETAEVLLSVFPRINLSRAFVPLSAARAGGLSSAVVFRCHLRCCYAAAMTVIASPPPTAASSPRVFSRIGCFYFLGIWLQSESGWSLLAGIVWEELRNLL